jgi:hypothetical protein
MAKITAAGPLIVMDVVTWYSFKMSFWRVPPSRARGTPERSATAT